MSPALRSKSKDKKAAKEPSKTTLKPSGQANAGGGIPASGYNPLLGTFQTIEPAPAPSAFTPNVNGRFQNIDETEDHNGNSSGLGVEYDMVSNNDSWCGESEEHKGKNSHHPPRPEALPGADNDKREKTRQKNERKHQRQKERRAQELHERCTGYLMSRKLEALAQQLVGMGFSEERATMALILNEGRVEESVNWLFEVSEEAYKHREHNLDNGSNLKIDISEELTKMADMENSHRCSKQEVERAVVGCEGDLGKAEEVLRAQKEDPQAASLKPEDTCDPQTVANKVPVATSQVLPSGQPKLASPILQQERDDINLSHTNVITIAGLPSDPTNMPPQQTTVPAAGKRRSTAVSVPSMSYSLASPLEAPPPPAKTEDSHLTTGNELRKLQLGSLREPVTIMHRPVNLKPMPTSSVSSSPPGTASGWYPKSVESVQPNGLMPTVPGVGNPSPNAASTNPMYHQSHYQQQLPQSQYVSGSGPVDFGVSRNNFLWSRNGTSLAAATSLGLFSGSSSSVDWNNGGVVQLDYTNIDWSVDCCSPLAKSGGSWSAMNPYPHNNSHSFDSFCSGFSLKTDMRPVLPQGKAISNARVQDGVGTTGTSGGSWEWTSPFEEREFFHLSRQFVSSPSL